MARLLARLRDFGSGGVPTYVNTWAQRACEQIEAANADLQDQITAIAAAQAAAAAAQATADTAVTNAATAQTTANTGVTNAATAQTTANTVKRDDAISTSWTSPGTILSGQDAGSDGKIVISAHTRKYSDAGTAVSVNGGTLTGLAYSTKYYVYYDQTSRAGGAVTYHATTDPNVAKANAAAGRHECGFTSTPAAAGAPITGGYTPPGGYSGPGEIP